MRRTVFLIFIFIVPFLITGCRKSKTNEVELYGNSFIHLNREKFNAPETWVIHNFFDSAFQVKLPAYMRKTQTIPMIDGCSRIIFMYRDTVKGAEYHYGRVGIDYYNHPNEVFPKSDEYISVDEQKVIFAPLIKAALRGYEDLYIRVPEGKIINGPFYESHLFQYNAGFVYDAFYRRKGHTEGKGAVSCHIFVMMNKTEAAAFCVSFHDQDSAIFSNLFDVVKTFKWNHIKN